MKLTKPYFRIALMLSSTYVSGTLAEDTTNGFSGRHKIYLLEHKSNPTLSIDSVFQRNLSEFLDLFESTYQEISLQMYEDKNCGLSSRFENIEMEARDADRIQITGGVVTQNTVCDSVEIPVIVCKDNWITLPFGGKTKIPGSCDKVFRNKTRRETSIGRSRLTADIEFLDSAPSYQRFPITFSIQENVGAAFNSKQIEFDLTNAIGDVLENNVQSVLLQLQTETGHYFATDYQNRRVEFDLVPDEDVLLVKVHHVFALEKTRLSELIPEEGIPQSYRGVLPNERD